MKYIAAIFLLALFLPGCQKRYSFETAVISVSPPSSSTDNTGLPDTAIFFDAVINGKREFHISQENGYNNYWASAVSYADNSFGVYEQGIESTNGQSSLIFFRGVIRLINTDTSLLLKNQRKIAGFSPGNYSYTKDPGTNSGVILRWRDENGKTWGTDNGTTLQANSSFAITKITRPPANPNTAMVNSITVACNFNCLLYDNTGRTMEVKNGRMRISVWL